MPADAAGAEAAPAEAVGPYSSSPAVRWLTPALAVFLLCLTLWNPAQPGLEPFISPPPMSMMATASLNDPSLAAYCDASRHSGYNRWNGATFEWTNGSHSLTTAVPVFNTNSLMP